MSAQDRVRWDGIYRNLHLGRYPPPDPLLFEFTPPVPEGKTRLALDLAGGMGQNGLWLAMQGYTVDVMDISRVALTRARAEMAMRNLRNVNLLQIDLDELDLEDDNYDLICVFRYLKRSAIPKIKAAIAPGGRIIYETFNVRYLESVPEFNPDFLLHGGELAVAFDNWKVLRDSEEKHLTQLVAIRPMQAASTAPANLLDW
ncbi:MAG: class I SAM-dependent methyltransferase [Chitinophagaceae bacterium]|nr:class I SAM-dependent methyltransferase [Anaerolineae bacterium]